MALSVVWPAVFDLPTLARPCALGGVKILQCHLCVDSIFLSDREVGEGTRREHAADVRTTHVRQSRGSRAPSTPPRRARLAQPGHIEFGTGKWSV
eukprot:COSAG02_NODE_19289_length_890_cov_1.227560_1_plen_95_part_00